MFPLLESIDIIRFSRDPHNTAIHIVEQFSQIYTNYPNGKARINNNKKKNEKLIMKTQNFITVQ